MSESGCEEDYVRTTTHHQPESPFTVAPVDPIQRMLHFGDQVSILSPPPQRSTPAKRGASSSPPRHVSTAEKPPIAPRLTSFPATPMLAGYRAQRTDQASPHVQARHILPARESPQVRRSHFDPASQHVSPLFRHQQFSPDQASPCVREQQASPDGGPLYVRGRHFGTASSYVEYPFSPDQASPSTLPSALPNHPVDSTPNRPARAREAMNPTATPQEIQSATTPVVPRRSPRQHSSTRAREPNVKQGRPPSEMWVHFSELKDGRKKIAVCNYCKQRLNNPKPGGNMTAHVLRNCKKIPDDVKQDLSSPSAQPPAAVPVTTSKDSVKPVESQIDQATFNVLLVEMVIVCALPFSILDSTAFRTFVQSLAPGVKVPPRQYFTKTLLEDGVKMMKKRVVAQINEQKFVSIVTDGWTDPNGSKIVNFMVVAPEMPALFWSSWASGAEAHTSENLGKRVEAVVEEIHRDTKARVVGIVTDNASNMVGMWGKLKHLAVVGGGCAAHVLNLLMKNLFAHDSLKHVHSNCVALSRFVRDHAGLLDTFRESIFDLRRNGERRKGLTLPVPTRWYSVFNCLENVLNNRNELFDLFTAEKHRALREKYMGSLKSREKLAYLTSLVCDSNFWENLRVVVRLIKPIREALGKLESDTEYASGVYTWFRGLLHHDVYSPIVAQRRPAQLPADDSKEASDDDGDGSDDGADDAEDEPADPSYTDQYRNTKPIKLHKLLEFFRTKIKQRWGYVHTNAMGIAFYLDPRTKLEDFEAGDERKTRMVAVDFAIKANIIKPEEESDLTAELFAYADVKRTETGLEKTSPRSYWSSVRYEFPLLGKISDIVFALPTSSAASERAWSIFNHIHTKKRNRLSVDKVEKLVYIYINYAATKGEKVDLARHISQSESFEVELE